MVRPSPGIPLSLAGARTAPGTPGATVSRTKSPSAPSGVVVTLPAASVVTVLTSIGPSPSVARSAAVRTTGLAVPSLTIVLVTVPLGPVRVTTLVVPASLLTVITPPAAVASLAVFIASPCGTTVTPGATVSRTKSPSAPSGVVVTLPAASVVTVLTSIGPSPSVARSAAVRTTGLAVPSLTIVLVTVPLGPVRVTTLVVPASLLTVITPPAAVASLAVFIASPCGTTVTPGAAASIVTGTLAGAETLPAGSVAVTTAV